MFKITVLIKLCNLEVYNTSSRNEERLRDLLVRIFKEISLFFRDDGMTR